MKYKTRSTRKHYNCNAHHVRSVTTLASAIAVRRGEELVSEQLLNSDCCNRVLFGKDGIKREQAHVAQDIAIREYVELPMHENTVLKVLSSDDWKMYNAFAMDTEIMVMTAPALYSLERKKLIMREMSGLYTLTTLGKAALKEII